MKRFENAQVGDLVYDEVYGDGKICKIDLNEGGMYPLDIRFNSARYEWFTNDGKMSEYAIKPTLFYRKGEHRNLTERPEPEIDWAKVPMRTKVIVADHDPLIQKSGDINFFMGYFPELVDRFWIFNDECHDSATGYKYCKLAEPCEPEWIKGE